MHQLILSENDCPCGKKNTFKPDGSPDKTEVRDCRDCHPIELAYTNGKIKLFEQKFRENNPLLEEIVNFSVQREQNVKKALPGY